MGRTTAAMAAGAALLWAAMFGFRERASDGTLVTEAVNDHLRVLYSDHPIEVESGGIHRVKPWFEGRLDFAPVVEFGGDDDFPLEGGSVSYFIDRKAATFVFKRRLHEITLFVFRAEGLHWPVAALRPIGAARGTVETSRGFHIALWRQGDLGYALVSDVNEADLLALGAKIATPSKE
jgi:anti-sigma factor RsiW